jgi:hypothetical protein
MKSNLFSIEALRSKLRRIFDPYKEQPHPFLLAYPAVSRGEFARGRIQSPSKKETNPIEPPIYPQAK